MKKPGRWTARALEALGAAVSPARRHSPVRRMLAGFPKDPAGRLLAIHRASPRVTDRARQPKSDRVPDQT
jgi:hypothetical protein